MKNRSSATFFIRWKTQKAKCFVAQFDILLVDIQDIGVRFYTYYIAMLKLMDVCAEYNKRGYYTR